MALQEHWSELSIISLITVQYISSTHHVLSAHPINAKILAQGWKGMY